MGQTTINDGDSGLVVRTALNTMFGELYSALIVPTKIEGITGNTSQSIAANSYIDYLAITATAGSPTIRIGTTPNGTEICPDIEPGNFSSITVQEYFSTNSTLYITLSGGTVNLRIGLLNNFF